MIVDSKKRAFMAECNRRRKEDLTIRGDTMPLAQTLREMGCYYDPMEYLWLAPSAEVLDSIQRRWPALMTGTPGPRMDQGQYEGWAAADLPVRYAQQVLGMLDAQADPELHKAILHRSKGGRVRVEQQAPKPRQEEPPVVSPEVFRLDMAWGRLPKEEKWRYLREARQNLSAAKRAFARDQMAVC